MSIPKEPRMQMISMMYLVLTALLAMNVSKEVLDAFGVVNDGITNSNVAIESKNTSMYEIFQKQMADGGDEVADLNALAIRTQQEANELYTYIEDLKQEIIETGGGYKEPGDPTSGLLKKDDIYTGTGILVGEDRQDGKGYELQQMINDKRQVMLDIILEAEELLELPTSRLETFESSLMSAPDPEPIGNAKEAPSWESRNFNQVPIIGTLTILTKYQNDVRSSESAVVEYLLSQIGATDFKVDKLSAKVIAPSSYLSAGKEYEADIFVAAFNSSQQYDVFLGSLDMSKVTVDSSGEFNVYNSDETDIPITGESTPIDVVGGLGKYKVTTGGVGEKKYEGVIRVKQPKGGFDFYPFAASYEVAPPSGFSVSPTKMNVLYIGVENPLQITVSGSKDSDVRASISGGSITPAGNGKFIAKVTSPGEANVTVTGVINGESKTVGSMPFRVKRIPDPVPTLGGKLESGKVQPGTLKAQSGVVALLKNFEFDTRFNVISFEMKFSSKGEIFTVKANGPLITQQMKDLMNRAKAKDLVVFDNIRVKGPDGQPRKLPPLVFEIL